jgi:hypothetical protein
VGTPRSARPWQSAEDYSPESVDSGNLPRCCSCAVFFGVTLVNSLCVEAATPLLPHDDPPGQTNAAASPEPSLPGAAPPQQKSYGTVTGRVVDQSGNAVAGTNVQIKSSLESAIQEVQSDEDGRFDFDRVPPGPFLLTTTVEGFVTQTLSHTLRPGESYVVPPITMSLATVVTEVRVSPSVEEIAQEEFKDLEQQRVLGMVPNFYVSYVGEAAPLTPKRKFELALKATTDPVTTMAVATIAGVDQATNRFSGYGQGAQGYAKRYGASHANFASGLWIGGAILPSILKQDLGTSIREAVPSVRDSCTLSLVPSFVKGTINAGSPIIPLSSATSLPAVFRICIYPKETVTEPC